MVIPMKPDGEVNTGRMVALGQIASGVIPEDALGELTPDDLEYIEDVRETLEWAKANGIENPMISIPNF